MPIVTLCWPALDVAVRCALLEETNPRLCASVWESLPIISIQTHAVVAGEQIYFPTRLRLDDPAAATTEDLSTQPRGRINFDPFFQYVSLNYGHVSEAVPAWPIAQVVEDDLPRLRPLGERIWRNLLHEDRGLYVIVSREGQDVSVPTGEPRAHVPPKEVMTPAELVEFFLEETDRIWLEEPRDARDLRSGRAESEAGVRGQYFSPWVMATSLIRGLAVVDVATLNRMVEDGRLETRVGADLLSELLRVPSGVIGYFGLPELGKVLTVVRASCPGFVDREELRRFLRIFSTYLNRYNLWLHQGFPWRLGELFRRG